MRGPVDRQPLRIEHLHDAPGGAHDLQHFVGGEPQVSQFPELLFDDVVGRRAGRVEALVEAREEEVPVHPQHRHAEHRDGDHEEHRVPGRQARPQ